MTDGEAEETSLARAIGEAVRARREAAGVSMRALAKSAGISQPFLSNVEHGKSMPSMVTIYRLARALGAVPGDLMPTAQKQSNSVKVVRAGEGKPIPVSTEPGAAVGHLLLMDTDPNLEVTEYRVAAGVHIAEWFSSPGTAAVYVIGGLLDVEIAGTGTWRLGPGDFVRHDGEVQHRWHLVDDGPIHALLILAHTGVS